MTTRGVLTGFIFSLRYFIPFDLFLLFFAGYGIHFVLQKYKNYVSVFSVYLGILLIFIFAFIVKTGQPLIASYALREIKNFEGMQNGYVLSTSKEDNAWLLGYTDLKLIAWNFGGENNYWNDGEWRSFFEQIPITDKINLLFKLPKPLYIYINNNKLPYLEEITTYPCVKKLSGHFYQFNCTKNSLN